MYLVPGLALCGERIAPPAWEDFRSGIAHDIYAQQVNDEGVLGGPASGVADAGHPPAAATLHPIARPNPFASRTTITYELPAASRVVLRIVDAAGREVRRRLVDGEQPRGAQAVAFEDAGLPPGVYAYRLEAGGASAAGKVVLLP